MAVLNPRLKPILTRAEGVWDYQIKSIDTDENLKQTDSVLAEWLHTSRQTIVHYKRILFRLGYLKLDRLQMVQKLSVNFFTKDSLSQLKVLM